MNNRVLGARDRLARHHYVRKASPETNYWADFSHQKLADYVARYGHGFCLILWGLESDPDDFYCIPFAAVHHLFTEASLDGGSRARWIVDIKDGNLNVRNCIEVVSVHDYYGKWPDEVLK